MADKWNIYRVGRAAAATTVPGQIVQANPAFAEFHSRYLGSDKLEQGSDSADA